MSLIYSFLAKADHLVDRNEAVLAGQQFDSAIRHGSTFESYYHLAELNSQAANRPDLCPVATAFYKIVAERGDWSSNEPWRMAEKAWARGDTVTALLGYWIMAERGYEVAQNNVAWILDQGKAYSMIKMTVAELLYRQEALESAKLRYPARQRNGPGGTDLLDAFGCSR